MVVLDNEPIAAERRRARGARVRLSLGHRVAFADRPNYKTKPTSWAKLQTRILARDRSQQCKMRFRTPACGEQYPAGERRRLAKLKRAIGGSLLSPSAGRRLSCSRLEPFGSRGQNLGEIRLAPRLRIEDGIQAMRSLLRRCWFDADKCAKASTRQAGSSFWAKGPPEAFDHQTVARSHRSVSMVGDGARATARPGSADRLSQPFVPRRVSNRRCARQSPTSRSGFLNLVLLADRGTNGIDRSVAAAAVALELHAPTLVAFRSRRRCRVKDTRSDIAPSDYTLPRGQVAVTSMLPLRGRVSCSPDRERRYPD